MAANPPHSFIKGIPKKPEFIKRTGGAKALKSNLNKRQYKKDKTNKKIRTKLTAPKSFKVVVRLISEV
jgi:hypothetical protein